MTPLQITPEHPPADQKGDAAADETTKPGHQQDAPVPPEELERAADEGMNAPPDDELTRPEYETEVDR